MSSPASPCMNCGFSTVDLANNSASPPPTLSSLNDSENFEVQESQFFDNNTADIQCRREGLAYEESLKAVTPPSQRLPPEILNEIFLSCVSSTSWVFDVWQPPWLLGMVCGHWRAVAISMPRLWSSLRIDLYRISVDSMPIAMFLVQTYLQRSGQSPLSLDIIDLPQVNCYPVLDVLVSHSTRWQDIKLNSTRLQVLECASGRLPLLRQLKIRALDNYTPPLSMFKVAPRLRDVTVVLWADVLNSLDLPWSQLTRYCGHLFGCKDALELLRRTPNLLQYKLYLEERIPSSGPGQPLRHLQLRHLDLTGDPEAPYDEFLDCLTLPALDNIRLEGDIDDYLVDGLISLLCRSSCSLTRLVIFVVITPNVDYIRLLQETPLLVELEVGGDLSTLITVLTEPSNECGKTWRFVPHLRSIIFLGVLQCDHSFLMDMIESRFRGDGAEDSQIDPVSRLQSVQLNERFLDSNARLRLQQLQLEGLNTGD